MPQAAVRLHGKALAEHAPIVQVQVVKAETRSAAREVDVAVPSCAPLPVTQLVVAACVIESQSTPASRPLSAFHRHAAVPDAPRVCGKASRRATKFVDGQPMFVTE